MQLHPSLARPSARSDSSLAHQTARVATTFHPVVAAGALAACLAGCDANAPGGGDSAEVSGKQQAAASTAEGKQLALGRAHGCSLDSGIDGVLCWGDNSSGQTKVPFLLQPSFIAAGGDVTCAVAFGGVRCWGDSSHGQLSVPLTAGTGVQ